MFNTRNFIAYFHSKPLDLSNYDKVDSKELPYAVHTELEAKSKLYLPNKPVSVNSVIDCKLEEELLSLFMITFTAPVPSACSFMIHQDDVPKCRESMNRIMSLKVEVYNTALDSHTVIDNVFIIRQVIDPSWFVNLIAKSSRRKLKAAM